MKRKYNTLNEEMNRMKSLFGESRLYGNLVSNEKTNLITEAGPGKRFFAKNLAKAFSVTLKTFEDLGNFTKFLNREINSVDDMIKHVDDFPVIWKAVTRNKIDMSKVRSNLDLLKKIDKDGKFKGLSKEKALKIVNAFPAEGGMQDMVKDMWLVANGKSKKLPAVIDTRIAVIDPKSGELVIGKQNTETGVVVGINKNGEMVTVENPKGEWKKGDDIDMERTDIEGEFVDFEEIPNGTPLDDLNGKTVAGTEENVTLIDEALDLESQKTGAAVNGSEEVKVSQQLSPEQQIKLKELENRSIELENRSKELDNESERLKNAKEQKDIKDNPEGGPELEPTGEPDVEVVVDPEKLDDFYSKMGRLLKLSWAARKKLLILKPKADESGFIRIGKMVGSSIIDPLGIFSMAKKSLPPPKSLSAFDPGNVIATTPVWLKKISRPLGGTVVNGLFWSFYLAQNKLPNPFTIFGYESDPNKYYFPRIYITYWDNLKLTPLVRYLPLGIESFGESQWSAFELEFSNITGNSIKGWEKDYVKKIPEYTQSYYDGLSCDELIGLRGADGKLTSEGNNSIANACSQEYNELMDAKFKEFEQKSGGAWFDLLSWITNQEIKMVDIASAQIKNVKGQSGEPVIEEQLDISILKRYQPGGDCYEETNDGGTEKTKVVYVREKV